MAYFGVLSYDQILTGDAVALVSSVVDYIINLYNVTLHDTVYCTEFIMSIHACVSFTNTSK